MQRALLFIIGDELMSAVKHVFRSQRSVGRQTLLACHKLQTRFLLKLPPWLGIYPCSSQGLGFHTKRDILLGLGF